MGKRMVLAATMLVLLVAGCGKTPAEKLVGTWDMVDRGATLVIMEDGRWEYPSEGTDGTWTLSDDDPPIMTIYDPDGDLEGETEVIFDGNDSFSMNFEGQVFRMERAEYRD